MVLKTWIKNADDAMYASLIVEKEFLIQRRGGGNISMFLLHYSLELYLKAFLMDRKINFKKSHDLEYLFNQCAQLDNNFESFWREDQNACHKIIYWIRWINPFNKEAGGIRYLNSKRTMWAYPLGIQEYFSDLIEYIKSNISVDADITKYC